MPAHFRLILLSLICLFAACKKDHRVLGTDVQPETDLLNADSFQGNPVYIFTTKADSVVSFNTDIKYIGSNNDPVFGKTSLGLYLNANMSVTGLDFGAAPYLGSEIILSLSTFSLAGLNDATVSFSVFTLDSTINPKRAYYTNNTRLHNPAALIGTTSTRIEKYYDKFVLRLPIDEAFAKEIMANPQYLKDNATFQSRYKGFYIQSDCGSGEGIIYQTDLSDEVSGFYIRYRDDKGDSAAFRWTFTSTGETAAKYNTVTYFPSQQVEAQLKGDTALGANGAYLRSFGSTRVKVFIPFLKNYADSFKVAVSRAEVVFYVDKQYLSGISDKSVRTYRVPPALALMAIDSLGREYPVADQQNATYVSRYGGIYDETKAAYVFNIALHAQAVMRGQKKNLGFYLVIADPTPPLFLRRDNQLYSVKLAGSTQENRPEFNISYVRFPLD